METLKAAACRVKINPDPNIPVKLLGWSNDFVAKGPAAGDLYARALLLEKDGVRTLILSLDICWASENETEVPCGPPPSGEVRNYQATLPPRVRAGWAAAVNVPLSGLTVHATHTHTAPALSLEAAKEIEEEVKKLPDQLQAVSLRAGTVDCPLTVYRAVSSQTWADDFLVNRRLTVLELVTASGAAVARLVDFGVHPILFKEKHQVHPDFVGDGMVELGRLRKGGVSLYIQGFSGDLGPNVDGKYSGGSKNASEVEAYGKKLAAAANQALENSRKVTVGFLRVDSREVCLPTREGKPYPGVNPVRIHGIALGEEALLLSVSAEVFSDYSAMVKNYCCPSYRYVLTSGVANGYSGYLPSAAAFKRITGAGLNYEVDTSPFVDAAQEKLLGEIKDLVSGLRP
jgi:neutral ceramidase